MAASTLGNLLAATIAGASPGDAMPVAAPTPEIQARPPARVREEGWEAPTTKPFEGIIFLLDIMNAVEEGKKRRENKPKKKGD